MQDEKKEKRFVGENALRKVVRLLRDLNIRSGAEINGERLDLTIEGEGSGELTYVSDTSRESVFYFEEVEEVVAFLEAPLVAQLLMAQQSRRH